MILHVNVAKENDGYVAVAKEIPLCWSKGPTIDDVIEKFKREYQGLLTLQFARGETITFDFHVIF